MPGSGKTHQYLFVSDVAALRRKIKNLKGAPALLWRKTIALADVGGGLMRSQAVISSAFCHLATGKDSYARHAIDCLKSVMEFYLAGDLSADVQFHTWCNSAPMARLAVALDWIADSRAVSAADFAAMKEQMLDYTLKHAFTRSKARVLTGDNQIASMSLCCAVVGYLFGVKRGHDLRAQRLLAAGAMRFPDIIGMTPKGGYSLEGSTYYCQIVSPVVSWYTAFMEQITGQELFSRQFPPNNTSVEDILRLYVKIIGPTGLMPPWDHYGWMRCKSTMALAYLASKTGDPGPVRIMERLNLCAEPNEIAWGYDDSIWTLLWWPDVEAETDSAEPVFGSWAVGNVGGALVDENKGWRLFQAWDRCSGGVYCGRCQVNPNMISLDVWGSPIFTDGTPQVPECTLFDYPIESFKDTLKPGELEAILSHYKTFAAYGHDAADWIKRFAYGLVGGSNSIVVNGEGHYSPADSTEGKLVAMATLPNFKLLSSEAASFYRPRYPIESMVRTSVLVRDDYFLVTDNIRASGAGLRYDWQVFCRGEVTAQGRNVNVSVPEEVEVDIVPLADQAGPSLLDAQGYPRGPENRSTRVQYTVEGADVEIPFLVVPQRRMKAAGRLEGASWASVRMDKEAGIAAGLTGGVKGKKTGPAADCGMLPSPDGKDGWVWAGRPFRVPAACKGKQTFLFFASGVAGLNVWVNGRPIQIQALPQKGDAVDYMPSVMDITEAVRNGSNSLVIAGMTVQGKLVNGAMEICVRTPKAALPEARRLAEGHYEITGSFGRDELILNPGGKEIRTDGLKARALGVLRSGDEKSFAALQARRLTMADVEFWSDRPIDVAYEDGQVTLGDLSEHQIVEMIATDFHLRVRSRGVLDIDLTGRKRPRIVTSLSRDKCVFCNGSIAPARRDPHSGRLVIEPAWSRVATPSDKAMPKYVHDMETLMRLSTRSDAAAMRKLIAALTNKDWKVQMMAAEMLGRLGSQDAVDPLIAVVAKETSEKIYADSDSIVGWGAAFDRYKAEGPGLFAVGPGSSPETVKRHRLKTVAIEALGLLRARKAVPLLCKILEDQREFYPVHSVACLALGLIGDPSATAALTIAADYPEINTKIRARDAICRITTGLPSRTDYPGGHE